MFGDGIKYICRLCWRFIIGVSDRQQEQIVKMRKDFEGYRQQKREEHDKVVTGA